MYRTNTVSKYREEHGKEAIPGHSPEVPPLVVVEVGVKGALVMVMALQGMSGCGGVREGEVKGEDFVREVV